MRSSDQRYEDFLSTLQSVRRPVAREQLAQDLAVSEKTITRYVARLIQSGVEVSQIRPQGRIAYQIANSETLPGKWFNPQSMRAFSLMLELLEQLGMSQIGTELAALKNELQRITKRIVGSSDLQQKLQIKTLAQRTVQPEVFTALMDALVRAERVQANYQARSDGDTKKRELSPSHIELYRNNWYLFAWCHGADAWRYFALERLLSVQSNHQPATPGTAPPSQRGYGIFDLSAEHTAVLRFSKFRAQWVSDESWHPQQVDQLLPDGRLERRFPYGVATELLRDLMREGADVEVIAPAHLRADLRAAHAKCLEIPA